MSDVLAPIDPTESPADGKERRLQAVLGMLERSPEIRYAWLSESAGLDVVVAVAIRDAGTCELTIDAQRYDVAALIEIIENGGLLPPSVSATEVQ